MSPRTTRQFEVIRELKRRQILDAAIECFANTGYHAVSISELARHAGISKGLLYNYFKSKDDLLKAIFEEVTTRMLVLFDPDQKGIVNQKSLALYLERLFRHLHDNLILWKMYMAIFSQPAVQNILKDEIQQSSEKPLEMIGKYFRKRGVKNTKVEIAFLGTLTSGVIVEYISDPENYPLNEIKKRIISLFS